MLLCLAQHFASLRVPRLFQKLQFCVCSATLNLHGSPWLPVLTHPVSECAVCLYFLLVPLSLGVNVLKWSHFAALWRVFCSAPSVFPLVSTDHLISLLEIFHSWSVLRQNILNKISGIPLLPIFKLSVTFLEVPGLQFMGLCKISLH